MTATIMARRPRNVKPRPRPRRLVKLALRPFNGNPGVLDVTVGKEFASYFLFPIPSDCGRAFHLEKFIVHGGGKYDVLLSDDGKHSCECKGFLRHGHCKHVGGLLALSQRGKLPAAHSCNGCADHGYQPTEGGDLEACPECQPRGPAYRSAADLARNAPELWDGGGEDGYLAAAMAL